MIKKIALFFIVIIVTIFSANAQVDNKKSFFRPEKTDLGLGFGTVFYLGDYNEWLPFYSPRFFGAIHHRYSFDMLYSLRTSVAIGQVAGDSKHFKGDLPYYTENHPNYKVKFSRTFVDINSGLEIGLRPFNPTLHMLRQTFAPYIFIGAGMTIMYADAYRNEIYNRNASIAYPEIYGTKEENEGSKQVFNIPIAFGVKISPQPKMTIAIEWQFKKTFWDGMDRFVSNGGSGFMNSDWVSTLGVSVSYRLMTMKKCPAVMPRESSTRYFKGTNKDYENYDGRNDKQKIKRKKTKRK